MQPIRKKDRKEGGTERGRKARISGVKASVFRSAELNEFQVSHTIKVQRAEVFSGLPFLLCVEHEQSKKYFDHL